MGFYDFRVINKRSDVGQKIIENTNDKIFSLLAPHFNDRTTLLEIAPGQAEFARRCIAKRLTYFAVEANESFCHELRRLGASEVINAFVPPLPFPDNKFDIVYASHLLEHMPDSQRALQLTSEIRRVLTMGGLICLVVPDALYDLTTFYDHDYTHSFITSENRLWMLLSDANFEIILTQILAGPLTGFWGWLGSFSCKLYAHLVYPFLSNILRLWIHPYKIGKLRTAFYRCILVIAKKG